MSAEGSANNRETLRWMYPIVGAFTLIVGIVAHITLVIVLSALVIVYSLGVIVRKARR